MGLACRGDEHSSVGSGLPFASGEIIDSASKARPYMREIGRTTQYLITEPELRIACRQDAAGPKSRAPIGPDGPIVRVLAATMDV